MSEITELIDVIIKFCNNVSTDYKPSNKTHKILTISAPIMNDANVTSDLNAASSSHKNHEVASTHQHEPNKLQNLTELKSHEHVSEKNASVNKDDESDNDSIDNCKRQCTEYEESSDCKYHSKNHIKIDTTKRLFSCTWTNCKKEYTRQKNLRRHEETHNDNKQYTCKICGTKFTRSDSLKKHETKCKYKHELEKDSMLMLAPEVSPSTSVKKCNKTDSDGHPVNKSKHQCPYCTKYFYYSSKLVEHIRTHTNERPFVCHDCNQKFKLKQHLKEHVERHNKNKKYMCKLCGKKFSTKPGLRMHEKRKHKNGQNNQKEF